MAQRNSFIEGGEGPKGLWMGFDKPHQLPEKPSNLQGIGGERWCGRVDEIRNELLAPSDGLFRTLCQIPDLHINLPFPALIRLPEVVEVLRA